MPRLVCISDTHLEHGKLVVPEGDILVHAGDLTMMGSVPEVGRATLWLEQAKAAGKFRHVVVIPGNHDWLAERDPGTMRAMVEAAGAIYLQHQPAVVMGLRFFGSGYTPAFMGWALNVARGPRLAYLWSQIPDDTEVLVTHGPPRRILDSVTRYDLGDRAYDHMNDKWLDGCSGDTRGESMGCAALAHRVKTLLDLKLHVFGHRHRSGLVVKDDVTYANASVVSESYILTYPPQVIDL